MSRTYEEIPETELNQYAEQILKLAVEEIQRNGWWDGTRGLKLTGQLCLLQAVEKGARILSMGLGNDAFHAKYRALHALCDANNINWSAVAKHNDRDLNSQEDAILDFKRAISLLQESTTS